MTRCDLDLWPVDLESRGTSDVTWSKFVRNFSAIAKSPAELLIILRFFAHVMSRCNVDLWPFDLELFQHFACHAFKLWTKLNNPRSSYWRFSTFRPCNYTGWGTTDIIDTGCVDQTWRGHTAITATLHFCFRVRILAAFSNARGSMSDVENDAKFRTFRSSVKIRGWVGEIPSQIVEALPTTEPPKYIWWPSTARLLSAAVIYKKKKESLWVKLKVFRHTSGDIMTRKGGSCEILQREAARRRARLSSSAFSTRPINHQFTDSTISQCTISAGCTLHPRNNFKHNRTIRHLNIFNPVPVEA